MRKSILTVMCLMIVSGFSLAEAEDDCSSLRIGASFVNQVPVGDYANFVKDTLGGGLAVEIGLPFPLRYIEPGVSARFDFLHSFPKEGTTLGADNEMRFYGGAWLRVPFKIGGLSFAIQPELGAGVSLYKTVGQKGAKADGLYAGNLVCFAPSVRWIPKSLKYFEVEFSPLFTWVHESSPYVVAETGARLGVLFRPITREERKVKKEIVPAVVEKPETTEAVAQSEPEPEPLVIPSAGVFVQKGEGFTPDGDEDNDFVEFGISCTDFTEEPECWILAVADPHGNIFRTFYGKGLPPEKLTWDGKSDDGETALSRNRYTAALSVIPDKEFRRLSGLNSIESSCVVQSGILLEVLVPHQKWKIVVNSITFPANSASSEKWTDEEKVFNSKTLDEVAEQIKAHKNTTVSIDGYSNNISRTKKEETKECLPLSEARARFVMWELVKRGVPEASLVPSGKGSSNPVVDLSDKANRWKNRRIEFVITKNNLVTKQN